jgi:hypothetical protein
VAAVSDRSRSEFGTVAVPFGPQPVAEVDDGAGASEGGFPTGERGNLLVAETTFRELGRPSEARRGVT